VTRVKICGVRQPEHALAAAAEGADMLGLVFAPSRRRIGVQEAGVLTATVRAAYPNVLVVGLFVNERPEVMEHIAREVGLDMIQLSGDEEDEVARSVSLPVMRAVHVHPGATREEVAEQLRRIWADIVLLDTGKAGAYGGTGEPFDWSVIPQTDRPLVLAGGLNAENVQRAVTEFRPWGVDVSSGVERGGAKDEALIRAFVRAVREGAGSIKLQ
jgi:phosphoribosylanthranilate isomerase